jgi:CRISPR-associated protein Csx1
LVVEQRDTLVILPWGNPAYWREVTYRLGEDGELSERFCTTLPLLLRRYPGATVAILALDSLVDEVRKPPERPSVCWSCYERLADSIRSASRAVSYQELASSLEAFVAEYVKCLVGGRCQAEIRPIVCPAVGRPGGVWRFSGRARDFEAVALYRLGELLAGRAYRRVVLDTSHGVNFMPAIAMRLTARLAGILLAAHEELLSEPEGRGVEVVVYNSDPVSSQATPDQLFNVNLVARERHQVLPLQPPVPSKLLEPLEKPSGGLEEEVSAINREYMGAVRLVVSSLYYPMPLALAYAVARDARPLGSREVMRKAYSVWAGSVEIGEAEVTRKVSLNPDAVYLLLLVHAVSTRVKGMGVGYPADVGRLEGLAKLYKAVNACYYYLIEDELGRVRRGEVRGGGWAPLAEVLGEQPASKQPSVDKRVMIAHAGLQKEFVLVRATEGGGRLLKYIDDWDGDLEERLRSGGLIL